MRPGDGLVVIGEEHDLDIDQERDREHDQSEPRHAVQEEAHDRAPLRAGDRLHEEKVVELEAQGMGAVVGRLEKPDRVIELERLLGEQDQLGDDAQMQQNEQDRRELEELRERNGHLQDG